MKKKLNSVPYLLYICTGIFWCYTVLATREKRSSIFTAVDAPATTVQEEQSLTTQPAPTSDATSPSATPAQPAAADDALDALKGIKRKRHLLDAFSESRTLLPEQEGTVTEMVPEEPVKVVPIKEAPAQEANIEFYFEDADIQNLLDQIRELYNVSFITDDVINPLGPGGREFKGTKISFKTHAPLTRQAAWNLFLKFLDLAGFALVPEPEPGIYRIVVWDKAQQMAVPTYIGVDAKTLPDNDQVIRYVYFLENVDPLVVKDVVEKLKTQTAKYVVLLETRALVLTDKATNIKSLMEVVRELDQVAMPQAMAVIKLQRADAIDVAKLYDSIVKPATPEPQTARATTPRKPSQSLYFSENVRIIAEPRTNSLIVFGSIDAIKKVEDFILNVVDVDLEKPYSPLHTYQLRYASATNVADIMNNITGYGSKTEAGKAGGVRGGDKYLKPLTFNGEPSTNTLVVKGDYEDFLKALEVIKRLDEPQPQVAVEALIVTIDWSNTKELGTQIRNRVNNNTNFGNIVDFQTSGLRLGGSPQGVVLRSGDDVPGSERLLGNLINLAVGATAGNTVVSLGADNFGVWGIFGILESLTSAQVISNPFLVVTNKTEAQVSIGETRRVVSSTIFAGTNEQPAYDDMQANLTLKVTPQINTDGMIILNLDVSTQDFLTQAADTEAPAVATRQITTKTIMTDREVIAIGGLIQNRFEDDVTKVPVLGDIPILGWLFKVKRKVVQKNNLLILISTRIIAPDLVDIVDEHTQDKLVDYYDTHRSIDIVNNWRDPVDKSFFEPRKVDANDDVETFLVERSKRGGVGVQPYKESTKAALAKKYGKKYKQEEESYLANMQQPTQAQQPVSPYKPSGMLQYLSREGTGTVKLSQNTTGRARKRRDARRSVQPNEQKGVMA
jgi:general secretion pathway protein D